MLTWVSKRGEWLREAGGFDKAYAIAVLLTLLLGFFLRVRGWLGPQISFWQDEANWATRTLYLPLLQLGIRPIGFMALTRAVVHLFGAREVWFRLLPALGGIGSLLLMPYVAGRLISQRWVRCLLLLLFAIHPALVDYSNEFKPYSWEVLVHVALIALYLRYQQTQRSGWFFAMLAYLPVSFLLAYNMALVFPGMLLLSLWIAWRSPRRKQWVAATLLSGLLCAAAVATIFTLSLKQITPEHGQNYWGKKYDVFYRPTDAQTRLQWTLKKAADTAAFLSLEREYSNAGTGVGERVASRLAKADRLFWIVMSGLGLFVLLGRRRDMLGVLIAPLVMLLLANFLGRWPLGAFRTNLFVLAYTFPLPFLAMDLAEPRARAALGLMTAAFAVVPAFAFGFEWHGHKQTFTRDFYLREVIQALYEHRTAQLAQDPTMPPERLLLEPHTRDPYSFYLHQQPDYTGKYASFFEENFIVQRSSCGALIRKLEQKLPPKESRQGLWLISSARNDFDLLKEAAARSPNQVTTRQIAGEHLLLYLEPKAQ
jgi:hypothetical protein